MARRLRFIPPNTPVEITQRVFQGRLLLKPSEELVRIIVGVLGRAQRTFGMPIHGYIFLSNHFHLIVTPRDAQHLAAFMGYLSGNLAREIGRLTGWSEKVWGRRYTHVPILGEAAQIERLRYLLSQGVKEGLVAHASEWPGASCLTALLDGSMQERGVWYDRTTAYRAHQASRELRAEDWIADETVVLSRLPALEALSDDEHVAFIREMVAEIEREAARERAAPALGAEAVSAKSPEIAVTQRRRSPIPLVHAATIELRRAFKAAFRAFVDAYCAARARLRSGVRDVIFPEGSFPSPMSFVAHSPP
jgi:hypothetical protein